MPSWKFHVNCIEQLCRTKNNFDFNIDELKLASVVPDIPNGFIIPLGPTEVVHSSLTHFKNGANWDSKIDMRAFEMFAVQNKLNSNLYFGYKSHLLLDTSFQSSFMEFVRITDEGIDIRTLRGILRSNDYRPITALKHADLAVAEARQLEIQSGINKANISEDFIRSLAVVRVSRRAAMAAIDVVNSIPKGKINVGRYTVFDDLSIQRAIKMSLGQVYLNMKQRAG